MQYEPSMFYWISEVCPSLHQVIKVMNKICTLFCSLCLLSIPLIGFAEEKKETQQAQITKEEKLELGRATYYKNCYRCHEYGQRGAPMLGYEEDWEGRIELGREALIDSVISGKGLMLPKATRKLKSRETIGLMVDYMLSTVTDRTVRDSPEMKAQVKRSMELANGLRLYGQNCFSCHNIGRNGAPRLGELKDWEGRTEQGVDTLVKHVISGHGRMIVKGGSKVESTAEIKSMVEYMLSVLNPTSPY